MAHVQARVAMASVLVLVICRPALISFPVKSIDFLPGHSSLASMSAGDGFRLCMASKSRSHRRIFALMRPRSARRWASRVPWAGGGAPSPPPWAWRYMRPRQRVVVKCLMIPASLALLSCGRPPEGPQVISLPFGEFCLQLRPLRLERQHFFSHASCGRFHMWKMTVALA